MNVERRVRIGLFCTLSMAGASCADVQHKPWYQQAHQDATQAASTAGRLASSGAATASAAYQRMQHYLAEKDVLKTFTDAGEHSEDELLTVLRRSRLTSAPPPKSAATAGAGPTARAAALPVPKSALPSSYGGALRWPLEAGVVSSEFGARWGKQHKGLDIAADKGEPVYAIADGQVIYAGNGMRGYGNVVIVQHDRHMTSLYAHNSELRVKVGEHVSRGSEIALLGSTGHSTGPHVHFEIREDDVAISPRSVLPKSMIAGVVGQSAAEDGAAVLAQR